MEDDLVSDSYFQKRAICASSYHYAVSVHGEYIYRVISCVEYVYGSYAVFIGAFFDLHPVNYGKQIPGRVNQWK